MSNQDVPPWLREQLERYEQLQQNLQSVLVQKQQIDLEIIDKLVAALDYNDASAPYLNLNDSVIHDDGTKLSRIDRDSLKAIQTPQAFKKHIISDIISTNESISDEIGLLINLIGDSGVKLIKGKQIYNKITTKLDFKYAQCYGKLL